MSIPEVYQICEHAALYDQMYHHCSDPERKKNPYLGGGCSRGSNAKHEPPFVFPLNDDKHKCDACHNMVHPPLLWVCENRRWEPDVRGVCVQCAATLMIESDDGPNIVVQNSHTVLMTSLFCVKIAHELRMVYDGVYSKDADMMIQLESRIEDKKTDAFVGIEGVVAVFIENQSSINDISRIREFVEGQQAIEFDNNKQFRTSECQAVVGVLLELEKFRNISHGRQILEYVAHGTDSHSILPYVNAAPPTRSRRKHLPLVTTDCKTMQTNASKLDLVIILNADMPNISISYDAKKETTRISKFYVKFAAPTLHGPVGANFLRASSKTQTGVVCTLCGVPLRLEDERIPGTLLEAVKDSSKELRVQSLLARGVRVRQNYYACLTCAQIFGQQTSIGAFYAKLRSLQPRQVVAREYQQIPGGMYLKITENFGKHLNIQCVNRQDQSPISTPHKVRSDASRLLLNRDQFGALMGKLRFKALHEKAPDNSARFKILRNSQNVWTVWQLVFYYEKDERNDRYQVYPLFDNINDVQKCILTRPDAPRGKKYSLVYVDIGRLPTTNLVKAEHSEFGALYRATGLAMTALRAVQMWRILGLATTSILRYTGDIDVFLHYIWDPFMLDELESASKKQMEFRWLELIDTRSDAGERRDEAPPLSRIIVDKKLRCGQRAFVPGRGKYICVYASCVLLWAHCAKYNDVDFEVLLEVLFLDVFFAPNVRKLEQKARELAAVPGGRNPEAMLATERALQGVRKSEQFPRGDLGLAAHAAARVVGDHARAAAFEALRTHEWLRAVALG